MPNQQVLKPEVLPTAPTTIEQKELRLTIAQKRDRIVDTMLDAKLELSVDELKAQFQNMDWDKYSRVFNRLKEKDVKVDVDITARGVLALFAVATE